MNLTNTVHKGGGRSAGWHSRGYLPHFDGGTIPQFVTLHLFDSVPRKVVERWQKELLHLDEKQQQVGVRKRVEKYLDSGYGQCFLRDLRIAKLVQASLLAFDGLRYQLFAWVIMPNHTHSLFTPSATWSLARIMHAHKSYTAHEANRILTRTGQFWMNEYFDRYIRNLEHFENTVRYIENNPVNAGLCARPNDWPFSSAWFRNHLLQST
jgi:putative DNA methylase